MHHEFLKGNMAFSILAVSLERKVMDFYSDIFINVLILPAATYYKYVSEFFGLLTTRFTVG